eukprot:GDKI01035673.1.p2 GENE.GDKI01035673.1~~GDKI01035673.1.p2  ORF type:complete len:186 (-),score=71.49 GDKI01035673.1:180-737(-)
MVKFSKDPKNDSKAAKAQGVDLRVHFKNTYETAAAIRGLSLKRAKIYLENILEHKQCVPMRKYRGCAGRTAQAKEFKHTQGRWPVKSARYLLDLLRNAESNAEFKNLDSENLVVSHIAVNQAQRGRRRTYRAHGRINPYMSSPCHVELFLEEKTEGVEKAEEKKAPVKFTKVQMARRRLQVGGGH